MAEATEFRPLDTSALDKMQMEGEDGAMGRRGGTEPVRRSKTAASTAAGLRAGLLRRGVGHITGRKNQTGRTPRTARQKGERPSWA